MKNKTKRKHNYKDCKQQSTYHSVTASQMFYGLTLH